MSRLRLGLLASVVLVTGAFGCATLPEVQPWLHSGADTRAPVVIGPRGALTAERSAALIARLQAKGTSDVLARHIAVEQEVAGTPLTIGNAASLLYDGPTSYRSMFEAIEQARDHVNAEFYIIEDDEVGRRFADLLIRKASQGVAVSLIYDSVGCIETPASFFERLRKAGVRVLEYNPINPLRARGAWRVNNRNHRKVVIVDGRVAFTGGINISDVYSAGSAPGGGGSVASRNPAGSGSAARATSGGSAPVGSRMGSAPASQRAGWRDTNVRVEGPAVAQFQQMFLQTWQKQGGGALPAREWFPQPAPAGEHPVRVIASGPGDSIPAIYVALLSAIAHAEKTVWMTMAYFVPDPQTLEVLKAAAARGVDVRLVLPSYTDFWAVFHAGRSHYSELLRAGIKIYERQDTLLHAKTVVIDGVWSTVGSSNLDWRSFLHNEELNVVVLGWSFGKQMEAMFQNDVRESARIDRDTWRRRPLPVRVKEWAARVWEYWL